MTLILDMTTGEFTAAGTSEGPTSLQTPAADEAPALELRLQLREIEAEPAKELPALAVAEILRKLPD